MNSSNQKGITLIALVITIIILLIIAGIGINTGINSIDRIKLEELRTNMLLIEAKAREYVEEANFKIGKETDNTKINTITTEVYITKGKLQKANLEDIPQNLSGIDVNNCYVVTQDALNSWGLNEIKLGKSEEYLVSFDESNLIVEVYNTKGYNGKYSLTQIEGNN